MRRRSFRLLQLRRLTRKCSCQTAKSAGLRASRRLRGQRVEPLVCVGASTHVRKSIAEPETISVSPARKTRKPAASCSLPFRRWCTANSALAMASVCGCETASKRKYCHPLIHRGTPPRRTSAFFSNSASPGQTSFAIYRTQQPCLQTWGLMPRGNGVLLSRLSPCITDIVKAYAY